MEGHVLLAAMGAAVVAEGLEKRYGAVEAVRGITFEVAQGTVFGFLGPNGAGKTSTMRMLLGLSRPSGGSLSVLGRDVSRDGREVRRRLGVVPQESNLDVDMTCRENLLVHGRFYGLAGAALHARVDEMLAYVELSHKRDVRASELSGGMKRRLLIARALMNNPDMLVLDEPTTGLDPQSRALLWERIRAMRREGRTVLLTTHYMEEAEALSDEVVVIDHGRIVARGRPRQLIDAHVGREVLELVVPPENDAAILARLGATVRRHERVGERLLLTGDDAEAMVESIAAGGLHPQEQLLRRATLEDVFLALTGRRLGD